MSDQALVLSRAFLKNSTTISTPAPAKEKESLVHIFASHGPVMIQFAGLVFVTKVNKSRKHVNKMGIC